MQEHQYAKLTLAEAPHVGPFHFRKILRQDPTCSWWKNPTAIERLPLPQDSKDFLKNPPWARIENSLKWAEKTGNYLIDVEDPAYPKLLREIAVPPPFLYVRGHLENLHEPQLGMVGCRRLSAYGQSTALYFSKALAALGITITSGLAYGIDAMSHQGALQAKGKTIAVLGTGLEQIYPVAHTALAEAIIEGGGCLVSELPPKMGVQRDNFPRRNRIISGLSLGILVVEAAHKSGSLITARFAVEQNRPVFAIPGPIHKKESQGCHQLLREGAILVENINDILEELHPRLKHWISSPPKESSLDKKENLKKNTLDLLGQLGSNTPKPLEELLLEGRNTREELQKELLSLELSGQIKRAPGGYLKIGKK